MRNYVGRKKNWWKTWMGRDKTFNSFHQVGVILSNGSHLNVSQKGRIRW